jgi:exodeoxyribonuclease VII small subunit
MAPEDTAPQSFAEVNARLAQIAEEVKDKDLPLEKSLDLYEEAVSLSNVAISLVQKPDLSQDEEELLETMRADRSSSEGSGDLGASEKDAGVSSVSEGDEGSGASGADVEQGAPGADVAEANEEGPHGT